MRKESENILIKSERTLPDEDLSLVRYECNVTDCEWSLKADSSMPYHRALRAYGQHNTAKHEGRLAHHLVNVYKKVGNIPLPSRN